MILLISPNKSKEKSETEHVLITFMPYQRMYEQNKHLFNVWNILEINDILRKTTPNCDHITRFLSNYILCEEEIYKAHLTSLEEGKDLITRVWSEVATGQQRVSRTEEHHEGKNFVRNNYEHVML